MRCPRPEWNSHPDDLNDCCPFGFPLNQPKKGPGGPTFPDTPHPLINSMTGVCHIESKASLNARIIALGKLQLTKPEIRNPYVVSFMSLLYPESVSSFIGNERACRVVNTGNPATSEGINTFQRIPKQRNQRHNSVWVKRTCCKGRNSNRSQAQFQVTRGTMALGKLQLTKPEKGRIVPKPSSSYR